MNLTITSIENAGPGNRARRLVFDEGAQVRLTAACVVKDLSLESGQVHEPKSLASELDEAEVRLAKERALRILGYRERSAAEVSQRLSTTATRPRWPATRSPASRSWDSSTTADSRPSIHAHALRRGSARAESPPSSSSAESPRRSPQPRFARRMDGSDEVDRAIDALRGRVPRDRRERERLLRHLVSKGFDLSTALAALDSAAGPTRRHPRRSDRWSLRSVPLVALPSLRSG